MREAVIGIAAIRPVATFTVIVLALGGVVVALGLSREVAPFALVISIPIAAIVSAWLVGGTAMVRGLFVRIVRWRVAPRWYLLAIGIPLLGTLAIDAAGIALGQASLDEVVAGVTAAAVVVPFVVFLPALFEEFAWRGFGVEVMLPLTGGLDEVWVWQARGIIFALIGIAILLIVGRRPVPSEGRTA